ISLKFVLIARKNHT
ncbi:acyl-CoA dehydrogenase, C-terminal domain protein, partial [Vibrio parahaemolyticus EKP-021]